MHSSAPFFYLYILLIVCMYKSTQILKCGNFVGFERVRDSLEKKNQNMQRFVIFPRYFNLVKYIVKYAVIRFLRPYSFTNTRPFALLLAFGYLLSHLKLQDILYFTNNRRVASFRPASILSVIFVEKRKRKMSNDP